MLSSSQTSLSPLAILGLGTLFTLSYRLFNFIHLFFLTPCRLDRYLSTTPEDEQPWALITGASDGIGFETTKILYARGFNVLMHGRNPEKLAAKAELIRKACPDVKNREIQYVVGPANEPVSSTDAVLEHVKSKLKGGRLRVLINNVGGGDNNSRSFHYLEELDPDLLSNIVAINVEFPSLLTRKLLPIMMRPAGASLSMQPDNVPLLVLNVGSFAGRNGMPLIATYSAGKSFGMAFSYSMTQEMIMRKAPVEILSIVVGEVLSNANQYSKPRFACLTSAEMAKAMIDRVGCGVSVVPGSWIQAILFCLMGMLPKPLEDAAIRREMQQMREVEDKML